MVLVCACQRVGRARLGIDGELHQLIEHWGGENITGACWKACCHLYLLEVTYADYTVLSIANDEPGDEWIAGRKGRIPSAWGYLVIHAEDLQGLGEGRATGLDVADFDSREEIQP